MQEIIYLSSAKLRDVVPASRPWWRRLRASGVSGGVGVGPVKLGVDVKIPGPDQLTAVAEAIDKADALGESAKWFEDPTLSAGELMLFEGRFGCQLVKFDPEPAAVLFCQLPEPGCRSVVLHGSAANVTTWRQEQQGPGAGPVPYSDPLAVPDVLNAAVAAAQDSTLWQFWRGVGQGGTTVSGDVLASNLSMLYSGVVAGRWFHASSRYLTGFAYTSGVVPLPDGSEIVLGSPLYVKRTRPKS